MHTPQESFDISGLALVAQGRPGAASSGSCSWAAGCAASHLLAPDVDRVAIDAFSNTSAMSPDVQPLLLQAGHEPTFVYELQKYHDATVFKCRVHSLDFAQNWRKVWLAGLPALAARLNVFPDRVVAAARAAGWEVTL